MIDKQDAFCFDEEFSEVEDVLFVHREGYGELEVCVIPAKAGIYTVNTILFYTILSN
ncbi:MAG: hypothetical protein H6767_00550 [Candidatus Peribacteria bacterium]|nr:MAG: hypothetical protein H6767_00550 [Candidatus Peribacteria bacterium]